MRGEMIKLTGGTKQNQTDMYGKESKKEKWSVANDGKK